MDGTPHSQTEMWRDLESRFGIFEKDGPSLTPSARSGTTRTALQGFSGRCGKRASEVVMAMAEAHLEKVSMHAPHPA